MALILPGKKQLKPCCTLGSALYVPAALWRIGTASCGLIWPCTARSRLACLVSWPSGLIIVLLQPMIMPDRQESQHARPEPAAHKTEEHTSELQAHLNITCLLLLAKKNR